jgi:signal transduction histidine kinase
MIHERTPENFRILVVDDEEDILEQFHRVLVPSQEMHQDQDELSVLQGRLFGAKTNKPPMTIFDLTCCRQGDEAVEKAKQAIQQQNPFSVVFLDMRMPPGPDGMWTAEHIRQIDRNIQIVIVTGFSDVDPLEITERIEPRDKLLYVQKPFHPQEIRQFATSLSAKWLAEQKVILESKNAAIRESDRLKREFIISISHELRTPLTIFKNIISNAMAGVMGQVSQKLRENLNVADESLNRLARIITDFIDIVDIDDGQFHLDIKRTSLHHIINDAVKEMQPRAEVRRINIHAVMPQSELTVEADAKRIRQVLLRLLSNAVKYIHEQDNICVRISEREDEYCIIVEDNGPGIERNDIEQVFSRFIQIQRQVGPGRHGTGLGLSIAKTIVELHGGKIWIESTPGNGASFCFTLPKYKPVFTRDQAADALQTAIS